MQVYLTGKAMKLNAGVFEGLSQEQQQELLDAALWLPQNLAQFNKDVRRGCAPSACPPLTPQLAADAASQPH